MSPIKHGFVLSNLRGVSTLGWDSTVGRVWPQLCSQHGQVRFVANKQPEGGDTAKYQSEGGPCELAFLELDFTRRASADGARRKFQSLTQISSGEGPLSLPAQEPRPLFCSSPSLLHCSSTSVRLRRPMETGEGWTEETKQISVS